MLIRKMDLGDLERVVGLEYELFSSPWKKDDFIYELEKNSFSTILVLEDNGLVIGYLGMWNLGDQSQITTVGVDKQYQGKGYATMLMNKCVEIAKGLKYSNINLEVRVSNESAITLYKKCGFKIVATRKNYYQDNHEDAYLMVKEMEV